MKTVYLFDALGLFTGSYEAQESPLEPGVFIAPTSSTDIAPPQIAQGESLRWNNGAWQVIAAPTPPVIIPPVLTPLQQIRALEQTHDDDQRKLTRISILELALDKVCLHPSMAGKTRAQVHTLYYAASRGYRELFQLEVQIAALRSLIV